MTRPARAAAAAVSLLFALSLVVLGCEHDGALEPVDGSSPEITDLSGAVPPAAMDTVTFVETFDNMHNEGEWSYYTTHPYTIEQDGGNPGWYLHDPDVVSFAPHPGTALGETSVFTGDYRARRVISVGIDLRSFDYDLNISTRYLALMLMNDNGTPLDATDDWGAYIVGSTRVPSKYVEMKAAVTTANAPGWVSYDFEIPAQSKRLPEGWNSWRSSVTGGGKASGTWSGLMADVDYVQFYYGDPTLYYLLDAYDLGLDNARLSYEQAL